jgi:cell division septum initiation protein DivIVA
VSAPVIKKRIAKKREKAAMLEGEAREQFLADAKATRRIKRTIERANRRQQHKDQTRYRIMINNAKMFVTNVANEEEALKKASTHRTYKEQVRIAKSAGREPKITVEVVEK